mmetsp:Transcript_83581/g.240167  ORF Transcript_83581/g.240167 Transcript_83581/m.240167 type:complete len:327 (-) Transcript_83581:300-1280(-)
MHVRIQLDWILLGNVHILKIVLTHRALRRTQPAMSKGAAVLIAHRAWQWHIFPRQLEEVMISSAARLLECLSGNDKLLKVVVGHREEAQHRLQQILRARQEIAVVPQSRRAYQHLPIVRADIQQLPAMRTTDEAVLLPMDDHQGSLQRSHVAAVVECITSGGTPRAEPREQPAAAAGQVLAQGLGEGEEGGDEDHAVEAAPPLLLLLLLLLLALVLALVAFGGLTGPAAVDSAADRLVDGRLGGHGGGRRRQPQRHGGAEAAADDDDVVEPAPEVAEDEAQSRARSIGEGLLRARSRADPIPRILHEQHVHLQERPEAEPERVARA